MLEQNNNYGEMNQGIDRITEILKRQSTPIASSPIQPQASQLPANILNAIASASYDYGKGGGDFMGNVDKYQTGMQNRELNQQKGILEAYDMKLKMGDAQAKALDQKLQLFTGDDPEGKALFLQALHDDPEQIDPSNSYQVMTKLAGIKKKLGYESPDLAMAKQKEQLDIDLKRAQIGATNALANKRNEPSSGGGKAPAGYRFRDDGSLEPIPGGPAEKIPAELSARLGLANKFLKEAPTLRSQISKGSATGGVDYAIGAFGLGESGKIQRRVADGADALQRMLTGAGMPASEAKDYSNRFRITAKDTSATATDKLDNLETVLKSQMEMAMRGHGASPQPTKSEDPRIQQARDAGYTDEEIQQYLGGANATP